MGNFFVWTVDKKPDQGRTPFFCLGKKKYIPCFYSEANQPMWGGHLQAAQGISGGNRQPRCCSSDFIYLHALDQCYSDGSSSSFVNTLYWVTQCICFQLTYSWNLAYNFWSTASVESFIGRGKVVNKSQQSWIWFLARSLTQAIVMQTATWLSGFTHKDLLSCRTGAIIQDSGGTSLCLSIYPHLKYL